MRLEPRVGHKLVYLQQPAQQEGAGALAALVGVLARVVVAVHEQAVGAVKTHAALLAAVGEVLGVYQAVLPQGRALCEGLATVPTAVGPLPCVCEPVAGQVGRRVEGLGAVWAGEGPFPRVCAQVVSHMRLLLEHLATNAALMAPFQPVHKTLVPGQLQCLAKFTAAQEAAVSAWGSRLCCTLLGHRGLRRLWLSSLWGSRLRETNDRLLWWDWCSGQRDTPYAMGTTVIKELGEVDKVLAAWTRMQRIRGVGSPVGQEEGLCAEGQATVHTQKVRLTAVVPKVLVQTGRTGEDTTAQGALKDALPVTPQVLL